MTHDEWISIVLDGFYRRPLDLTEQVAGYNRRLQVELGIIHSIFALPVEPSFRRS